MIDYPRRSGFGMVDRCPNCGGAGTVAEIENECCGNYLPTGECCAAAHGTANLVPVAVEAECRSCGGRGEVEL